MSRSLRLEYAGALYHVTARGNERKKIYFTQRDYGKFKEYLLLAKERFGILIHAYVLMGNHYHLIMETPEANLSRVMHFVNGSYTTYVNTKRERSGHLLQGRYKSFSDKRLIQSEPTGFRLGLLARLRNPPVLISRRNAFGRVGIFL